MSTDHAINAPQAAKSGFLSGTAGILLVVALFLALVAVATITWGLPGLAMSALACVPVISVTLILITVGK